MYSRDIPIHLDLELGTVTIKFEGLCCCCEEKTIVNEAPVTIINKIKGEEDLKQ